MTRRPLTTILLAAVCSVAAAACGGSSNGDSTSTGAPAASAAPAASTAPTSSAATSSTPAPTAASTMAGSTAIGPAGNPTAGKAVFTANCAGCHTLEDAGSSGHVGPNLDQLKPEAPKVQDQVEHGGGGMPAFKGSLSDADIASVAAYVASVAGK